MDHGRPRVTTRAIGILLTALMAMGGAGVLAQDASPTAGGTAERPAHIHAGSCPEVGDVVAPLESLTSPGGGSMDGMAGMAMTRGLPAEYSYSTVPLALDDILAGEHAINIHESPENIGNYIACGDLAGTVDANGSLVVGLGEVNGSGFSGIAVLTTSADDPATTNVSVFIAEGLSEDGGM